jgi:hypothetical protein
MTPTWPNHGARKLHQQNGTQDVRPFRTLKTERSVFTSSRALGTYEAHECANHVVSNLLLPRLGDLEFTCKASLEDERGQAVHHCPASDSDCLSGFGGLVGESLADSFDQLPKRLVFAFAGIGVGQMKSSFRTVIDHPADRIDLAQWLSRMTDREYQACSRAHRAAGTFREGGTFGMVNVESIGDWFSIVSPCRRRPTISSCLRRTRVCMYCTSSPPP